jgi:superfamily II DNA or RNA helicase
VQLALSEQKRGTVLILVDRIEHGEYLQSHIADSQFICGELKKKEREEIIDNIRNGSLSVVIATKLFDEGVDFPSMHTLILAAGGRSGIKMIQRTGRVLRLFQGKDRATIYDFIDRTKYLFSHSKRRVNILKKEPMFNIVSNPLEKPMGGEQRAKTK